LPKQLNDKTDDFISILNSKTIEEFTELASKKTSSEILGLKEFIELKAALGKAVGNIQFDPTLVRGFDYYTGMVFEVFDLGGKNTRSLFGGGRYDDLLSVYGTDKVPAVGFGMGDVTIRDFLETYNLLPVAKTSVDIALCIVDDSVRARAQEEAAELRAQGLNVVIDVTRKKIGDQIKWADKNGIPFVMVIGEKEINSGSFMVKELQSGTETAVTSKAEIAAFIKKYRG
jgi:histidyl-tRNA synthetase